MTSSGALRGWLTVGLVAVLSAGLAGRAEAQRFGRGPTPGSGACFYENPDFQGDYFCVRAGEAVESMPRGMNDKISSIRTFGRAEVRVFQDSRFEGRSGRFDDVRDLRRQGWNDRISSIRVEGFGGGRDRDRDRFDNRDRDRDRDRDRYDNDNRGNNRNISRERASDIVRRAYQSVLHRDPDPAAQGYVDRVMRDGWSQADVERELRKSPEARQARPR
jgi:hypothetical protein